MALTANQDWLYKQMSGMNVDLGSEEQFAQAMQEESNRQWVYEQAGKMGIDLGTPEQFASAMQMPAVADVQQATGGVSGGSLLGEQEELARQNTIQGVTNDPNHPFVEGEKKQPNAFQTFYKGLGAGVINTANGLLGFLNRANSGRLAYDPVTLQQMAKQGMSPEEIGQAAQATRERLDNAETERYNAWKAKADQLSAEAKPDGGEKSFTDYLNPQSDDFDLWKALQLGLGTAAESLPYTASALNPVATASMIMSMSEQNYRKSLIDNPDMSDGQRLASAAGNAAIEMAVEHIGNPFKVFKAGKLTTPNATKWIKQVVKESKDNIYKGILRVLGFGAKEAGKEGLEEGVTTAGQDLYNTLLDWKDTNGLGLQSQWKRMKEQNPNITPEEFAMYKAEGLTNDFIGGALSGMMMSGPSTGVGVARAAKYYSKNGGSEESRTQAQQQLAVLQQLSEEFGVSQERVAQAIVDYQAEKELTPAQQAIINRGEEIITNLQNAQSATQATEPQEAEQLTPAAAEYRRAMDEVTQSVQERTHGNGYIYPVAMPGNAEKTGYIVGEVVPVIDESNPELLRIENDDVVTVKWSDGTVTQERARDLNLTGAPMMAQQAVDNEVENQMYAYTQQRIQNGEQPVLMRNGEGILEGFFPMESGLLEDQNGVQYTPEQLAEQGWQETKPVLFVNDTQQIAALDNGDGTYTQVDALGNPIAEPMSAEAFIEQGFAMVPLEEEQPKSQAPVEAPVEAPVVQQAQEVQQPEVQEPAAPVVPNIETMSAEELGGSAVEYMGDKASAMAYLEAERDKADAEVKRTAKLKVTRFNGPEDFKRQNDQIQSAKRAAIDRYNKLQNAITAANAYKTLAEQKEEAERKAREAALREQRRQLAEAETAGDIEAKWQNTKKTVGFAATKTLPNGQKVNGHYILTEAGDVVPSHDPRKNYADSEGYVMENGQNVNDNNYKDPDVQRIALDIAQNYGGQAVEQMPFLENRAGRVLSGNNRTISGIIAAENNTDQAYLEALAENAQQYGFTPEQLAEYQHPRLQFVVEDELPFTTATFAMFNAQEKKTKSSVNRAVANSKMVTEAVRDRMLEIMDQYESLDSFFGSETAAADIVQALITEGLMTQQEVAGLTEKTGTGFKFGQSGREYVTDMLLGTLFDEQTIKMLAGEKTLKQAILRALPSIVANRRLKGYELTDSINNAIQLLYEARKANEGKSTADAFQLYLRQVDAFKGSVMDNYNGFDIILANRMSAGVEQLREILGLYNNSAMNEANGQMGFFEPRTIDDIKQDVYEYYTNQQPELAAALNGAAATGAQPQSAVPSGVANEGEARQEVKNPQENLQESEKSSTFAGDIEWTDDKLEYQVLSEQEKQALIAQISDGKTEAVQVNINTFIPTMASLGASQNTLDSIAYLLNSGKALRGCKYKGKVLINTDHVQRGVDVIRVYVHERQHLMTEQNPVLLQAIKDNAAPEELARVIREIAYTDTYDTYLTQGDGGHAVLADEFISHIMQEAYATGRAADAIAQDYGITDERILQTLNRQDNVQKHNRNLAKARRSSLVNRGDSGTIRQNERNQEPLSAGSVAQQGSGSDGNGNEGTGSGGQTSGQGLSIFPSPSITDTEIGGALVDRLEDMGLSVSTDLQANRDALKAAKADKSEAGAIHYFKTPSGKQYGFAYKGKVYLDPTKIDAELPIHEYGHLWAEALRRLNPENWQRVVETIKADKEAWAFVRELRPELTDENEIAEEVIATFSGKNGAEKMRAEYERMHGKDADYKSKWGNIFKNISKAIQDFWKAVGDFLNIKYTSAEQVYDQVLKDFVDNMNPWKRVSDYLQARDNEYVQAAESGDIKKATNLFYDALKENIGNGITPYMSVGTYTQLKRLAKGVKTRNERVIKEAAAKIAPLIPDNAVLIPAPSHDGRATDMLDLAKAVAEITGSEVANVLRSAPRESQYQAKKATGVPMASGQLGITMEGTLPEGKTPIIIDNVVDSGNTAEACVQAVGRAVVVTIGDSAEQYRHAASLKSAAPVLRDKAGKVIPLSKRFEPKGSRYLGRRMYLSSNDPRFAISGTQVIPVAEKTLVGLHNISAEKLRKALKMGGLANPSAAVIDIARQNHEQYGDVSLIMPSSLVDSKTGRNAGTFTGDIWSPTYPSVERIMSDKGDEAYYQAITKAFGDNEARRPILSRAKLDFDDYLDSGNIRAGLAYWYLLEKGIEPGDVYFNSGISDDIKERFRPLYDKGILDLTKEDYRTLISLIAEQQGKTAEDMLQDAQESKARFQETIDAPEAKLFYKKIAQQAIDEIDLYGVRYNILSNGYHQMERAIRKDGKIDLSSTLIAAQDIVQTQYQADFDKWISDMDERFDISEVLFQDYDRDGNRIYKPHTLTNVSRMMNKEDLQNAGDRGGLGATRGILVKRLETLADIRAEKGRLRPGTEEDIETEEWNKMQDEWFNKVLNPLSDMQKISDNPFSNVGYAETCLQEALRTKDPIATLNKEYRYHIDKDSQWAKDLADMVERVKNLPTKYFETKFRRPVYLNEFANAVVPNDLPQDLRAGLESAGLRLFSYDPNTQGSRRDATLEATAGEGIRFSVTSNQVLTKADRKRMAAANRRTINRILADKNHPNHDVVEKTVRQFAAGNLPYVTEAAFQMLGYDRFAIGGEIHADMPNPWEDIDAILRWAMENKGLDGKYLGRVRRSESGMDDDVFRAYADRVHSGEQLLFSKDELREIMDMLPQGMQKALIYDMVNLSRRNDVQNEVNRIVAMNEGDNLSQFIDAVKKHVTKDTKRPDIRDIVRNAIIESDVLPGEPSNKQLPPYENNDIRFSVSNASEEIFYSNAERAVEGIKQEKATPEQWRAMIEKAGGLKAGEDKWIGLSDWLAQQRPTVELQPNETRSQYIARLGEATKRFTLTKQQVLDYIREHKIQIEEVEYADELSAAAQERLEALNAEFQDLMAQADAMENSSLYLSDDAEWAYNEMKNSYGDDFEMAFEWQEEDGEYKLVPKEDWYNGGISDAALYYLGDGSKPINETRKDYTTEGLENKREIALTVPTIESWNEDDEVHFGDAGEGRAIAWVRFGDAWGYDEVEITHPISGEKVKAKTDKKVLVIDEIQSKRHQEGREKGYKATPTEEEYKEIIRREKVANSLRGDKYDFEREMKVKYGSFDFEDIFKSQMTDAERDEWRQYDHDVDEAEAELHELKDRFPYDPSTPPVAPFEKNWHELAMKRILRFAAENGYDKVAWTTGDQQAARYNLGKRLEAVKVFWHDDTGTYTVYVVDKGNDIDEDVYLLDNNLDDEGLKRTIGKDMYNRVMEQGKQSGLDEGVVLTGDDLVIGTDGMKGFYDDMLPRFMQKYGKKWGVQVGEVTMPDLEEGYQTMHAIDINDAMRESVMEGQPMFSISGRGVNGTMKPQDGETRSQYIARVAETVKNMTPRNTTIDDAIRFSITVNHNSPYLLKRADGAFVDPETGERLGFDHRFMGKGEGVQAHGCGSYFSVNDIRSYAESYKERYPSTYHGGNADYWTNKALELKEDAYFDNYEDEELNERARVASLVATILRGLDRGKSYLDSANELINYYVGETREEFQKTFESLNESDFNVTPEISKHHYTVEIPDNDGTNYFEEDQPLTQEQIDRLRKAAKETGIPKFLETISGFLRFAETNPEEYPFRKFYSDITDFQYGYPRETISNFLKDAGFVGIHYDGRRDGECYVIFDENDAKIVDHIRFAVSGRRVFGGNSGYVGYSKSVRAVNAEEEGKRSISNFDNEFVGKVNTLLESVGAKTISLAEAKRIAKDTKPDEWHHTSMYGNKTNYYSPETIAYAAMTDEQKTVYDAAEAQKWEKEHAEWQARQAEYIKKEKEQKERSSLIAAEIDKIASQREEMVPWKTNKGYYINLDGVRISIGKYDFFELTRQYDEGVDKKVKKAMADKYLAELKAEVESKIDDKDNEITDHIRFAVSGGVRTRSSIVTEALVKQANNNYGIMQSALKKVTADLKGIRAAMRMQSDYDRKVVDALLNLYNTLLQENGVWAQYMPDTTRRIATQIVHAIGKQNITEEVNTIMDHMVHAQAQAAQRQWDKLRQTPIDKINISGVVMQGKVALEGQHALKAMNDALQANMTIEQIEEQINQLMNMEDNATDESLKTQYKGQWIGLTIAAQHLERLQHLQEERQQLDLELQSARSNKALKPAARQQLVENIKQAMRDNYIEQAEAYTRSTQDLSEYVNTQEGRAKDFIRRQDANRDKIRSYAQRDLEGLATNPNRNRTRGNVARSIWDAFASPIRDLQSLLRLTGLHAPDGEGYLYNHFMRNWMDGADMERTGIVAASKTLDEKIAELTHGKYKTWEEAARKIDDASHNMFGITMLNGVDGKDMPVTEEIPLNAGNALYIYAVNKMNDGRMKLNGMNITEEDVQALADKVREQFGQEILDVVDWVQSEFFSQLRNRYNPTHEALFGAPMDAIENYFPLRINANARQQNEDLSEPDTDAARLLAGTSTGAIKRRTRNSLPLDVRNADFFQEVIRHISQMERWNAFAQWNRDANILFSDINFRNRIKGMNGTIYGEGDKLYNYMKDAFRVAIGTYKPKTDTFSEITLNMAKGVTSAKINFRIFTAFKQIASFPAFFTYMQDGVFVQSYLRNWLKPHETMKWAKENLPNFEKRVSKLDMGDMRLMQRSTDWQWNKRILEWSSKYGMFFNVFFDTLNCATGARAVYDSHLADYMKKGYSLEQAEQRARQDAEQAFNTSQQSSEGAFMSAVQMDRNLVTAALTVFRTSPIQYTRNFFYHTRNLLRKFGEGKRDEQIAFRMGQYKNDGLNDEQARKAAEKDYNKSLRQDIVGFVVYGALLNILWRLAGQIPYLLLGDDDDKKKQILDDATSGGAWFSPFTGLLGGGIVESALDGNGSVADMFAPEMPFTQDIKRAGQYLSNDKYAEFASQALSVLMQSATGFDPLTASDMVSRIVTTLDSEEELDAATQALRVSQAILSIPQSQYEQMLIDKVVSGETDEDAALEDYIRYQKVHTAPLTWWLRGEESDEKAEENAEKRFNKLLTERDKIKNPEDYEE